MKLEPYLTIAFICAFGYAASTLFLKRSIEEGVGAWRTVFISNIFMALLAFPFLFTGGAHFSWLGVWLALLCAVYFMLGQITTFLAMAIGDVSLATPIMGVKIILVAVFLRFIFGESQSAALWTSAILATLSVVLLQFGGGKEKRRVLLTIVTSLLSAAFFAVTDVSVQKYSVKVGASFLWPTTYLWLGILSFALIPFFHAPLKSITANAWKWLFPGCAILSVQSVGLIATLGHYGHATEANIAYSTRGLWSIVLVWGVGHWFKNTESKVGHGLMLMRMVGALLLLAAVAWVLFGA